nr:ABC transporter substrate-binding protein [Melghiribacillus thermohalophilus]
MLTWIAAVFAMFVTTGCSQENVQNSQEEKKQVSIMLDWYPNTNHTGLYVAKEKGYFEEQGLEVEILQPGQNAGVDSMVASGEVDFGIGSQEGVTQARANGIPIVSIAAIIQHNTSAFASLKESGIESPKDFAGKTYGGWGSAFEEAMIKAVMNQSGADFSQVEMVTLGISDFFQTIGRNADFMWIFYGWDGVEAEKRGIDLNVMWLRDLHPALDYYTPVVLTNEKRIQEDPETVRKFMKALSSGYEYAIQNPEEAAEILLQLNPELDEELVISSQKWLSPRYQDEAERWGEQKEEVWKRYADWMYEQGLIKKNIDPQNAFTNEFLPDAS